MLLLLNWGFRMGSVSFLVLFLLSHSVLLSSAEEERKQPPTCPPFDCEKLGRLHFPFKNETNSECGLCTIERCTEELPRIQLERGGRYFGVKNISQADTIVIQDDLLKEYLQRNIWNEKRLKLALGLGISAGSITILIICFFIIWQSHKREYAPTFLSRNTSSDPSSKSELEITGAYFGIPIFPYTELEEATNYFDPDREIGDGGFGTVYHGQLRDGREVAVKRLYENNYRRVEQFMNEVKILTRLRHRNLVSLYGCTSRHSRELLLVYEFIPNGTVADHLHGDRADSGLLTWPIRLSIAIETATALSYLHASDVVHRDVKTNNILLDNSFCVKVADFGLSRLFPTDVTHVSTAPQGTPGYVDPEYHQCYQLTDKSDVYSFGVVLIELISSLPAVDISRHRHEINLSNYAINKIQKCAFHELIDPHLGFNSDLAVNRMTTLVAELAFRCLQPDKEMRPSMDEVLEILKEIESDKHELENMDTAADSFGSSMRKPPSPSPDCDEVGLLKSVQLMPSPDTVIAQWPSRSTTPSASA
ncbi:LEAF RUST 10 DISEASE-RESISTANCE LOCUS RECEPTOR-LIKE PROTEIN KINASE-like 1.1 isoform X2 [Vitis riparia]|uniref:LEAF RUST 10 DISEASE-RESISTANCE LOCUS RECEPTOR-LIKE PROTEIN KINASE-like 1.1 isoform X2 n=1 Tax=Vitis riparia TaxID=96939 RepID=UPI00155A8AB3|nr:LEAF RUST 10 DISEASE-RESISTANCE LOCUS RECEPTOR-LIKE PROTEIN KINASE-like 1.1 isoform X2 [Vitis riparia]